MMGQGYHWMQWGGFGMWLWPILIILAIVFLIYLFSRATGPSGASGPSGSRPRSDARFDESPMEILKRRYAAGEIDKEEFERMKKDLSE